MPKDSREKVIDLLKELYRRDFERFAKEQIWLTSVEPGKFVHLHPFTTPQEILYREAKKQREEDGWVRIVAIKGRQFGFSSLSIGWGYHLASLNPAVDTLHLACDDDTVSSIFGKAKLMHDRVNEDIRPLSRFDNKKMLRFENPDQRTRPRFPGLSSQMRISHAKNILSGTGTTGHFLHLSEAAKYNSEVCARLESSLMPSLHLKPGTVCINESTAYVRGDYFRSCCDRAMSGKSEWRFVFVPWYAERRYFLPLKKGEVIKLNREERRIEKIAKEGQNYGTYEFPPMEISAEQWKWRRNAIASHEDGENFIKQEYPTTFEEAWISYDINVFDRARLHDMRDDLVDPKRFARIYQDGKVLDDNNGQMGGEDSYLAIWEEPDVNEKYDIGLDTSAGLEGGDFCVAEVVKRRDRSQVAEFRCRLDAVELGEKIYFLGRFYNTAQVALELANSGFACNAQLQRLGYPYLYIWRHRERAFPTLSSYSGWKTTRESKSYMLAMYCSWVNKKQLKVRSRVLWNEMYNYIKVPGMAEGYDQYMAERGYDDCVMSFGIALIAADDETYGRHAPDSGEAKSRKELIEEALRKGGPAFTDNDAPKLSSFLQSQKNLIKGYD